MDQLLDDDTSEIADDVRATRHHLWCGTARRFDLTISRSTTATRMVASMCRARPRTTPRRRGQGQVVDETERELAVSESVCHPWGTLNIPEEPAEVGREMAVWESLCRPWCKTCTHVSYQRILILTLNFNTSFVGHLPNVETVFFSVFVERCSRVRFGCNERHTWLAVLKRTHVFSWSRYVFFWTPRKLSCLWYRCCLVDSGGNLLNTWL